MSDIADKFIEKLEKSKSKRLVDLLIVIDNGFDSYSVISNNGEKKVLVSLNGNYNLLSQLKNYLNSLKTSNLSRYNYCDSYGFIQTELTAIQAVTMYNEDKFKDVNFIKLGSGCPVVIDNTISYMEVEVKNKLDCGSHTIFLGELTESKALKAGKPMTYDYYHNVIKGKTPKTAPTFIKKDNL